MNTILLHSPHPTFYSFFRLGINLRFEIPKLDTALEAAEQVMRTAQASLAAVEAQRNAARAELDAWRAEQRAIDDLSTRLQALGPAFTLAERTMDEYRARLTNGANAALDVGVFFGGLVARTVEWGAITSATALAEAVIKLQRELETDTRLTGVFIDSDESSDVLNDELKRLADSNVPPDGLSLL